MLIMYDFDGTLIDSTDAIYESFCVALGRDIDLQLCKSQIGLPLEQIMTNLGANTDIDALVRKYKKHYQSIYLQRTRLLPGAKDALNLAKNHAKIALVTTKSTPSSVALLRHFGLYEMFSAVVGRDDVKYPKPNAQPLLLAMHRCDELDGGISFVDDMRGNSARSSNADEISFVDSVGENLPDMSAHICMIGDTVYDMQAAANARVLGIATLYEYQSEQTLRAHTAHICQNVFDATKLALELMH